MEESTDIDREDIVTMPPAWEGSERTRTRRPKLIGMGSEEWRSF